MSALTGYYTEFDFTNKEISFTPLLLSDKKAVVEGTAPTLQYGTEQLNVIILSSVLGFLVIATIALCTSVNRSRNRTDDDTIVAASARSVKITVSELEKLIENAIQRKSHTD